MPYFVTCVGNTGIIRQVSYINVLGTIYFALFVFKTRKKNQKLLQFTYARIRIDPWGLT